MTNLWYKILKIKAILEDINSQIFDHNEESEKIKPKKPNSKQTKYIIGKPKNVREK